MLDHYLHSSPLTLHTIGTNSGKDYFGNFLLHPLLHEYKEAFIVEIEEWFAELMAIMNGEEDDCTVYYWNLHYIKCNNIEEYKMFFFENECPSNEGVSWPVTIPPGIITNSLFLSFFNFNDGRGSRLWLCRSWGLGIIIITINIIIIIDFNISPSSHLDWTSGPERQSRKHPQPKNHKLSQSESMFNEPMRGRQYAILTNERPVILTSEWWTPDPDVESPVCPLVSASSACVPPAPASRWS